MKTWKNEKLKISAVIDNMNEEANDLYKQIVHNPPNKNMFEKYSLKNAQLISHMKSIAIDNKQKMKQNWLVKVTDLLTSSIIK